jgi:hypothetical protein
MAEKAVYLKAFDEAVEYFASPEWDAAAKAETIPLGGKFYSIRAVCAFVDGFDDRLPDDVYRLLNDQLAFDLKQKLQRGPGSYGAAAAILIEQLDRGGRGERPRPQ